MTPLDIRPVFEPCRLAKIEPVQECAAVEVGCLREVANVHGVLKGLHIARDKGWVQAQFVRAKKQPICMKVTSQGVAALPQEAAPVRDIRFGPEVGDEFVATETAGVTGEQCQESKRLALSRCSGARSAVRFEG